MLLLFPFIRIFPKRDDKLVKYSYAEVAKWQIEDPVYPHGTHWNHLASSVR